MALRLKISYSRPKTKPSAENAVPPNLVDGDEIFTSILHPPGRRWLSVACSFVLHGVMIIGVAYIFDNVQGPAESLAAHYTLRMIRVHHVGLSQPRGGSGTQPPTASAGDQAEPESALGSDKAPSLALSQAIAAVAKRPLQLPTLPVPARSGQILIQPDFPPDLAVNREIRVPEVLLWKPHLPPAPARKVFVAQKRTQEPAPSQNLPAPPALDLPNDEKQLAALPFSARMRSSISLLTQPPASTTPIGTGAGTFGPVPQIGPFRSDNIETPNILSIPDMPVPGIGVFPVPAGNQGPAAGYESGAQFGGRTAGGSNAGNGSGVRNGQDTGGGNGQTRGVAGEGLGASAMGRSTVGTSNGSGSPGHVSDAGGSDAGDGSGDFGTVRSPVTKIALPPDGHFSVFVESSASQGFPEAEGVLTGKLVYTVYVRAGRRKEWMLQYCLPREVEQRIAANRKTPPLEAPYPYLMLRLDLSFGPDIDYLIVHGMVTTVGKFDQLAYVIAPAEQTEAGQLLHSLQQWLIRPGKLDGQPVALEVLLVVPRDSE